MALLCDRRGRTIVKNWASFMHSNNDNSVMCGILPPKHPINSLQIIKHSNVSTLLTLTILTTQVQPLVITWTYPHSLLHSNRKLICYCLLPGWLFYFLFCFFDFSWSFLCLSEISHDQKSAATTYYGRWGLIHISIV